MPVLYGPTGNPISSIPQMTKEAPPKLGGAFGAWAGRDLQFVQLPGGGIVQFDLSKLTISDFRAMRYHYQVNASLAVLSFMQHQSDFHLEGPDAKVAERAEADFREIWTPLNRGMSTANWAGFAPHALDWENDLLSKSTRITKVKDLVPEECRVNWKEVDGWAPPGRVKPKFKVYDGIKQAGQPGWPIPVENCVHPDTKILCSDLIWRRAGDIEVGQEIVAFDETNQLRGRRYKTAVIEVNNPLQKDCVTVTTDIGEPITMSVDHPCLVRRGAQYGKGTVKEHRKDHWTWVNAGELQTGDRIGFFSKPWEEVSNWESGYIAGIFDGEGSLSYNGASWQLSFTQCPGWVLERALDILDGYEFKYSVNCNTRDDCNQVTIHGGIREIMRFVGMFRPERIGRDNSALYENVVARIGRSVDVAVVQSIKSTGMSDIASIQTSSGTFITEGYLTHNSFWYPLLMENGDYYGRKLLAPAFTSWFFSILVHLFANRYYERFGEPTPVGRAPFDDEITVEGKQVRGNQYMLDILQQLRSRSVVVLPNDRTQDQNGRPSFDYDINYLESQMRGADFERYMTRLDEEISIGLFTPILLLRTADVGSYNLGVGHMQMYLWMLNAMNDDRKAYVDPYILRKWTNYNVSTRAPAPKIVYRKMGNAQADLLSALISGLVASGKAKPDIKELGQMAGMTLTEIAQTTGTPPTPPPPATPPAKAGNLFATLSEITDRVRPQVENAFNKGEFRPGLVISMGYKRRFEESAREDRLRNPVAVANEFYSRMDSWLEDVATLGPDGFSGPDSFMSIFENAARNEVERLVGVSR